MFMTVKQASEKWGISDRRIRVLCAQDPKSQMPRSLRYTHDTELYHE